MGSEAFRRFERETHDRLAATYCDFFAGHTRGMIEPLLAGARVGGGLRVLDVACGPGDVAAAAAARGAHVSAVDLSPEMVALAARRHPGLDVRQGDAEALPFPDGAFDTVVCNFGLGHFPGPEIAAKELTFLDAVAIVGAPPPADVPPGPPVVRFSEEAALKALLVGAGLADVSVTTHAWTHRAPSVDAWWHGGLGGMARVAAAIRGQTPEVQQRTRAEFERLAAEYAAAGGGYDIPNSAKLAAGAKP